MRDKWQKHMPLMAHIMDLPKSQELEAISAIIDANGTIYERYCKTVIVIDVYSTSALEEQAESMDFTIGHVKSKWHRFFLFSRSWKQ